LVRLPRKSAKIAWPDRIGRCRQTGVSRQARYHSADRQKPATPCLFLIPGFVRSDYVRLCVDFERSVTSGPVTCLHTHPPRISRWHRNPAVSRPARGRDHIGPAHRQYRHGAARHQCLENNRLGRQLRTVRRSHANHDHHDEPAVPWQLTDLAGTRTPPLSLPAQHHA
jgi:hypothetical protein